jgi:uncharacterized membrane protein YraQ (UPF0718 family)
MKKLKKRTAFREDIRKLLSDLGKMVFGGIFLGGILRGGVPHVILIAGGFAIAVALCTASLLLGIKDKNGKKG